MKKRPQLKCKAADCYDAISPPMCATDKLLSCDFCVAKWQTAQAARIKRANERRAK